MRVEQLNVLKSERRQEGGNNETESLKDMDILKVNCGLFTEQTKKSGQN